jgi:hypothetical protein
MASELLVALTLCACATGAVEYSDVVRHFREVVPNPSTIPRQNGTIVVKHGLALIRIEDIQVKGRGGSYADVTFAFWARKVWKTILRN